MLSTVLVSKSLINSTKINKIYEEYRTFNNSIKMFYDTYDCNAGDCTALQIPDLVAASAGGMSPNTVAGGTCFTNNTTANGSFVVLKTNLIESTAKRSCQFIELQLAGFITGIDPQYTTLTDSIAGKNLPYAKFNKIGAWDFRYISNGYTAVTNSYIYPQEQSINNMFLNKHALVLRNATTITGTLSDIAEYNSVIPANATYALSASLSMALDLKFDDGLPLSGSIMGGVNAVALNHGSGPNSGATAHCSTVVWPNPNYSVTKYYLSGNDINKGCLVAFAVDLPSF